MPARLTAEHVGTVRKAWGRAVRKALAKDGGSLNQLASDVGVSRQYLTRILDGQKPTIPVMTYRAICGLVGLDPNKYVNPNPESTPPWE